METTKGVAVVYDRASTAHQKDNYSRADAARLVQLAEARGYRAELRQEIKSGEDLVNRPVMRRLLRDVADGTVQAVVVQHLDRLSRDQDQTDGRLIREVCREAGCLVITPDKTYDFAASDADDDLADVQFLMAKFQKRSLVRQTVTGMKEAARQGRMLPPRVPVGFDVVYRPAERPELPPRRDFAVNPAEAAIVRRIFDLYENRSQGKIARTLNAEGLRWPVKTPGIRARNGGRAERPFRGGDVYEVIRNELYAGFVTWGKQKRSRHLRDFDTARVFREDLQIVPLEQWDRAQRIRAERKRVPARSVSSPYLLSGLLKCPHCGGAMSGHRPRNRPPFYTCHLRSDGGKSACEGQWVAESVARAAVVGFLRELFTERIALEPFVAGAARLIGNDGHDEQVAGEARAELRAIEAQKRNLVDAVASGALRGADVAAKNAELDERREHLERRLAAAGTRRGVRDEIAAAARLLEGSGVAARIAQLPDPALQRLCRLVFRRLAIKANGRGPGRTCEVGAYELTPEFADLLAHHGAHASQFAGFAFPNRL